MSKRRALDEVAARQRAADESARKKPSGNRLRWLFNQRWFMPLRRMEARGTFCFFARIH